MLAIAANEIDLGSGTLATSGFGGGVTLTVQDGIFAQGVDGVLDVGAAPLTIHTPYIGDRAIALAAGTNATISDLALTTTGAMVIDNAGTATLSAIAGIPGSGVTLSGNSVSISGTTVNATAGKVQINSATGITLANARSSKRRATPRFSATAPIRSTRMRRAAQ